MINRFSKQIINSIVSQTKRDIEFEQLEVYIYGLECFINTAVPVIILTAFSIFTSSVFETWLWIMLFSVLQKYTGGYHAPSQLTCMTSTIGLGIINTLLIRHCSFHWTYCSLCYVLFALLIIFLCPLESHKIELTLLQKKQHKCYALGIVTMISLLSLYLPDKYSITLMYSSASCLLLVIAEILHRKLLPFKIA